jgi:hypothetical protein
MSQVLIGQTTRALSGQKDVRPLYQWWPVDSEVPNSPIAERPRSARRRLSHHRVLETTAKTPLGLSIACVPGPPTPKL